MSIIPSRTSRLKTMAKDFYSDCGRKKNNTDKHCLLFFNRTMSFIPVTNGQQNHNVNLNVTLRALCQGGRLQEAIHILLTATTHNSAPLVDSSTCLQLLETCIANKALAEGKFIHSHINDMRYTFTSTNVFLQNKLIHMYVNCASLADARQVFDQMTERDVFSWNMMISAYQRHGLPCDALALFHQMQQTAAGVQPNQFSFPSILQACAKLRDLKQGLHIHQRLFKSGFLSDIVIVSPLLDMYAKCGRIQKARDLFDKMSQRSTVLWTAMIVGYTESGLLEKAGELFDQMPHRDAISWTVMIAGYAKEGLVEKARELFDKMPHRDAVSWTAMISGYAQNGLVEKARDLFDKMPHRGAASWNAMIAGYAQNGYVEKARELFDKMPQRGVVTWNTMIAAYAQNKLPEKALEIYKQMQLAGIKPSSATFASILSACAKMDALEEGIDIHQKIVENGLSSDVVVSSALIDMYAKCGRIRTARELFDKMHNSNTVSWNAMISGYAQNGLVEKARELFDKMPNQDAVSWTAMIAGYAQNRFVEKARKLFDKIPQRVAGSWDAMIAGYAQNGLLEKALETFKQMQFAGVKPTSMTFASVLPTCAKMGALEQGMYIHQRIIESGFLSNVVVASALIDMYAKCGSIHKARELFDRMHNANTVSWNAMIAGYAMHGYIKDALELFELMKHVGTNPDNVSFACVLFACSHAGLVDEGCKYFNSMRDFYCLMPMMDHYVCIVDLLGRAGYLEETLNFIVKIPIEPDMVVWMCLLSACKSHKRTEIGEFVATILFVLDPKYAASYVLLSNIYAEVGSWDGVQRIRKLMKDRGIKKTPGCSWIEVQKKIITFF